MALSLSNSHERRTRAVAHKERNSEGTHTKRAFRNGHGAAGGYKQLPHGRRKHRRPHSQDPSQLPLL